MNAAKVLGIGGSLLLVATAALHLSAYGDVSNQLRVGAIPEFSRAALQATWVFFSVQLVIVAAAVAAQFASRTAANRAVLLICVAMLVGNLLVMIVWLGLFIGTVAVAMATVAIGGATAILMRAQV